MMELNTDIETLAKTVTGRVIRGAVKAPFNSFETDTRKLKSGEFFWAFKGAAHDAHVFLEETLEKNVKGWIVEDHKIGRFTAYPEFVIGVWDTLKALHRLAAWHRNRFPIPVAAITGSNGKSTTKEMLKSIFEHVGPACSNLGNLNNQFGLPLSLLELQSAHKFGVFELGASKKGDVFEIGTLAKPTAAVITNIGPAHLEYFGDLETVFRTKTEIIDCLAPGGTLVYNADDKYLEVLKARKMNKIGFGWCGGADLKIGDRAGALELRFKDKTVIVNLPGKVRYNYLNAAAAAGAALAAGLDLAAVKAGLEAFTPPPMRMQTLKIKDAVIILDAYNANPASMRAALETFFNSGDFPKPWYLALGDMKELGKYSAAYHAELGRYLAGLGAEKIFLAGPEMKAAADELLKTGPAPGGTHAAEVAYDSDPAAWTGELRALITGQKGSFLIKASRAMQFERLIEGL
ncbi:MAG: UDP-N-acetylmuramoyl-tripeptide--D-alanyl-D-alanine ligase [Elusimicrobia bacterium]|nr:UDP-N-acetylmuramoyl-tripeptide--D-alanyl-D-alanine ligase [Elusimicrobiota bacterium]